MIFTTEPLRAQRKRLLTLASGRANGPIFLLTIVKILNSTAYRVIKPEDGSASSPNNFSFFNLCVLRASVVN